LFRQPASRQTFSATGGKEAQGRKSPSGGISRAARSAVAAPSAAGASSSGYKVCRDTYFQCMDEFCSNKNAQLRRCACSARIREFAGIKQTLGQLEDKMLDFNERLLAVSMDKEDATAMSTATEGEEAFQQDDKSESQKMLDSIMKKLQTTTAETSNSRDLSAISLSLDSDAFDTIDSFLGAETTTKEGEALYRAALPTCREMAAEVCGEDEIPTVQSAYSAAIEQDCNTVAKTYAGMKEAALGKVREGGALLDMARLNNQQTRNSDDVLTCKKKMLEALSDTAVCGEDLGKCLDWSGKYIDPLTGGAILTENLYKLEGLIKRPSGDETWAKASGNDKFVIFLNSKKKYIEPAMKNCESLEATVWNAFIEDALAQIKLAQGKKLEDMRQGCTTLTSECLTNASASLISFDSRSLSIFGVNYDRNANEVCSGIQTACTALLNGYDTDYAWGAAVGDIATKKTYDQIFSTCMEVGKNCIVRNCMNIESKFGLCQSATANMRTHIFTRSLCWDDILNCVKSANTASISNIVTRIGEFGAETSKDSGVFKEEFLFDWAGSGQSEYSRNTTTRITQMTQSSVVDPITGKLNGPWLWCANESSLDPDPSLNPNDDNASADICRITERIWGHCDANPMEAKYEAEIVTTGRYENTLLAWLAGNTNASCRTDNCERGYSASETGGGGCVPDTNFASDHSYCAVDPDGSSTTIGKDRFFVTKPSGCGSDCKDNCCKKLLEKVHYGLSTKDGWTNCCAEKHQDTFGNCCADGIGQIGQYLGLKRNDTGFSNPLYDKNICTRQNKKAEYINKEEVAAVGSTPSYSKHLVCIGEMDWGLEQESVDSTTDFPNGETATCGKAENDEELGRLIIIDDRNGLYLTPDTELENAKNYYNGDGKECEYISIGNNTAGNRKGDDVNCETKAPENLIIKYIGPQS
jgi:hypothetical protein